MKWDKHWLECACDAPEHAIRVDIIDDGESNPDLILWFMYDPNASLWQRVKRAFRHVFRPHQGDFHDFYVTGNSAAVLRSLTARYINMLNRYEYVE